MYEGGGVPLDPVKAVGRRDSVFFSTWGCGFFKKFPHGGNLRKVLSKKFHMGKFEKSGWLHKKALLLADLESPGWFQMHYFNGKTEENMQHTLNFSPAAR